MTETKAHTEDPQIVTAQLRGETIAYAVQSGITNLAGNLFEPYVSYRIQKHYSKNHGNYTQNLAGEFAGDVIGSASLIAAEIACPELLHSCTRKIRSFIDPLYTSVAHAVLASERNAPDYEQQIDQWKLFQERNAVRAGIIFTAGLAGNLATQKLIARNPSPTKVIFLGNLASSALTTAIGLCGRLAFPEYTKGIDNWMGKHIGSWVDDRKIEDNETSHVARLEHQTSALTPAR